jgi:hypothetical protein
MSKWKMSRKKAIHEIVSLQLELGAAYKKAVNDGDSVYAESFLGKMLLCNKIACDLGELKDGGNYAINLRQRKGSSDDKQQPKSICFHKTGVSPDEEKLDPTE